MACTTHTATQRNATGFTLVELLVAMAILSVLLAMAAPSFSEIALNSRLNGVSTRLVTSVLLARAEAIKRNRPVTLCMSADGGTCTTSGVWGQGWIVIDTNASPAVVLHKESGTSTGYRLTGSRTALIFQQVGISPDAVTNFTLCRYAPSVGSQERIIMVHSSGKPSTQRTTTGTCS